MKPKVVVGLSGGVDSSVCAYLLKEQGYDVIGVTMQTWQDEGEHSTSEHSACGQSAVSDAKKVAESLMIPHYVIDFKKEFKECVIDNFVSEYLKGRTPNPCVVCNRKVKWEALLERSKEIGADYIATGHYASVIQLPNGRYTINCANSRKDQSYALYNLTQQQLSRTLMPLGAYEKSKIRKIAKDLGLLVADKPDSQDICFIPDNDYAGYIRENTGANITFGNFVDKSGNILGVHKGITNYTIGQRKGLGLSMGHPVFVTEIRPDTNEVVIGENKDLFSDTLYCESINLMSVPYVTDGTRVLAKIRYSHAGSMCTLYNNGDGIKAIFDEPVRAITPGQAVVFYEDNHIYGGGIIL